MISPENTGGQSATETGSVTTAIEVSPAADIGRRNDNRLQLESEFRMSSTLESEML